MKKYKESISLENGVTASVTTGSPRLYLRKDGCSKKIGVLRSQESSGLGGAIKKAKKDFSLSRQETQALLKLAKKYN